MVPVYGVGGFPALFYERCNRDGDSMQQRSLSRHAIIAQCRALAEPIAAELGLELFDLQLVREGGHLILRVTIDSQEGISHTHCEEFSRKLDPLLDAADPIADAYYLEVSSPGVERQLRGIADYKRFLGEWIYIEWRAEPAEKSPESTAKAKLRKEFGYLAAVDDTTLTLRSSSGSEEIIAHPAIRFARLQLQG